MTFEKPESQRPKPRYIFWGWLNCILPLPAAETHPGSQVNDLLDRLKSVAIRIGRSRGELYDPSGLQAGSCSRPSRRLHRACLWLPESLHGSVQSIDGLGEIHRKRLLGIQTARGADKRVGELGINAPVARFVGVG